MVVLPQMKNLKRQGTRSLPRYAEASCSTKRDLNVEKGPICTHSLLRQGLFRQAKQADLRRVYSAKPNIHTPFLRDIHTIKEPHLEEIPGPDKFRKGFLAAISWYIHQEELRESRNKHSITPEKCISSHLQNITIGTIKCSHSRMLWTPFLRLSITGNSEKYYCMNKTNIYKYDILSPSVWAKFTHSQKLKKRIMLQIYPQK